MVVYRLQNKYGRGPFHGDAKMANYLMNHNDPEKMLRKSGLNKKAFNKLCSMGWLFAWSTKDLQDKFLTPKGRKKKKSLGFEFKVMKARQWVLFEDGQVLFRPYN
jgi:hypothetical protein